LFKKRREDRREVAVFLLPTDIGDALKQRKIMKKKWNRKRKCIEVSLIYSNTVMQHITVLSEI